MKRLLTCMLIIIMYACSSIKEASMGKDSFEPIELFMRTTNCPQCVIDSICDADSLMIDIQDYTQWNKREVFTSDLIVQPVYWLYSEDAKLSIMVFEANPPEKYVVKMVK